jgi:hypothetical protein
MRKPLSKPFTDERPRLDVSFIANNKVILENREFILSYVEKKYPLAYTVEMGNFGKNLLLWKKECTLGG